MTTQPKPKPKHKARPAPAREAMALYASPNTAIQYGQDMALYTSPYNAIPYQQTQQQPSACSECMQQGKECAHECWTQTRYCVSEMTLCQALGVGCIVPPLCTPLLLAWWQWSAGLEANNQPVVVASAAPLVCFCS